jgi:hypothetical protein
LLYSFASLCRGKYSSRRGSMASLHRSADKRDPQQRLHAPRSCFRADLRGRRQQPSAVENHRPGRRWIDVSAAWFDASLPPGFISQTPPWLAEPRATSTGRSRRPRRCSRPISAPRRFSAARPLARGMPHNLGARHRQPQNICSLFRGWDVQPERIESARQTVN